LGTGGGMIFITRLLQYTDNFITLLLIWIVFFVSLSIFGFYASKKNWKKEYESLFEELQKFKESMLNNEKQL
jgi:purine-cytosine permease-like protein